MKLDFIWTPEIKKAFNLADKIISIFISIDFCAKCLESKFLTRFKADLYKIHDLSIIHEIDHSSDFDNNIAVTRLIDSFKDIKLEKRTETSILDHYVVFYKKLLVFEFFVNDGNQIASISSDYLANRFRCFVPDNWENDINFIEAIVDDSEDYIMERFKSYKNINNFSSHKKQYESGIRSAKKVIELLGMLRSMKQCNKDKLLINALSEFQKEYDCDFDYEIASNSDTNNTITKTFLYDSQNDLSLLESLSSISKDCYVAMLDSDIVLYCNTAIETVREARGSYFRNLEVQEYRSGKWEKVLEVISTKIATLWENERIKAQNKNH